MPVCNRATIRVAIRHLKQSDRLLADVIRDVGPYTLRPNRDRFGFLVGSIISQQISTSAARSIRTRLAQICGDDGIEPGTLLSLSTAHMRSAGLSAQKVASIRDLAQKAADGTVVLNTIGRRSDDNVIAELTQVRGVGHWTAQMFLMFALGRLDVFPAADLGIQNAIHRIYALPETPNAGRMHRDFPPMAAVRDCGIVVLLAVPGSAALSGSIVVDAALREEHGRENPGLLRFGVDRGHPAIEEVGLACQISAHNSTQAA